MKSSKVADKTGPFRTTFGKFVPGTKYVREFRASNTRTAQTGGKFTLTVGGFATGKINLRTDKVTITGYSMVR